MLSKFMQRGKVILDEMEKSSSLQGSDTSTSISEGFTRGLKKFTDTTDMDEKTASLFHEAVEDYVKTAAKTLKEIDTPEGFEKLAQEELTPLRKLILRVAMEKSAVIKHEGDKWILYDHLGNKVLGRHNSEKEAQAQERAIQASKHS